LRYKIEREKKNNNQETEYHIWYINKTNQMKMNETKKSKIESKTKKDQLKERGL
jgi:hypothetical protein